ncbi:hypothetical protein ACHAW5_000036 [Stephanodiscus triporus]|uniref:Uncharacterized protein n=1 Tax=Stephanodiscus triporus TaxID=2934178 RepID=A0ABD3PER4_9STRA
MDRMKANTKCLFMDMTWVAWGSTTNLSLQIALHMHRTANMHLTYTNMEKDWDPFKAVHYALKQAFDGGIGRGRELTIGHALVEMVSDATYWMVNEPWPA